MRRKFRYSETLNTEESFRKLWNSHSGNIQKLHNYTGWAKSTIYRLAKELDLLEQEIRFSAYKERPKEEPPKYIKTNNPTFDEITQNAVHIIKTRGY